MQTAQQKIISYLSDISHGIINIGEQHANAIMFLAGAGGPYVSTAIKYKYSNLLTKWDLQYTINTTDETIDKFSATSYLKEVGTAYKYECLKANGETVTLYSNQCSLFD